MSDKPKIFLPGVKVSVPARHRQGSVEVEAVVRVEYERDGQAYRERATLADLCAVVKLLDADTKRAVAEAIGIQPKETT